MSEIKTVIPDRCHLWTKQHLKQSDLPVLEMVETYLDEDHLKRSLVKCSDCGQHYYREYYEEIDWEDGNDPQYRTYIPIIPDPDSIKALSAMSPMELLGLIPRLLDDWNADGSRVTQWIRK
jgi:hypothetical protein